MANSIFSTAYKVTKTTNSILGKAGSKMIQSSFDTAKKIAGIYKEAGVETYKIGKKVVKATLKLTIANQKELIHTSGEAIKEAKEAAQHFRQNDIPVAAPKARKSKARKSRKKELSIDDLLPEK